MSKKSEPGEEKPATGKPQPPHAKSAQRKLPKVLPSSPEHDSARAWGDTDDSNDERLRHEKPPHW